MTTLIDVWNLDTFDAALMGELRDQQQLLIDYFATDRTNYLEREASDHRGPKPSNPHASAYYRFAEDLMAVTQTRTIRAWHHTRMTDREVETATSNGLYPATVETLRARLADRVADGDFSADEARVIFEASPFHNDQLGSRGGKFWMTSHPHRIDDSGVTSLLAHWGGESAYFNHDEGEILRGSADPDKDYMEKIHPEKMRLSLDYIRNRSLVTDLKVLGQTARAVFR